MVDRNLPEADYGINVTFDPAPCPCRYRYRYRVQIVQKLYRSLNPFHIQVEYWIEDSSFHELNPCCVR